VARNVRQLLAQALVEVPAVVDAGELIGQGEVTQLLTLPSIVVGHGGNRREAGEEPRLGRRERRSGASRHTFNEPIASAVTISGAAMSASCSSLGVPGMTY
jgi:hypothetical protein